MLHKHILEQKALKQIMEASLSERFCEDLAAYLAAPETVDISEQRVVRQFVEAILFEQLIEFTQSHRSAAIWGADSNGPGFNNARSDNTSINNTGFESIFNQQFDFHLNGYDFRCLGTCRAFDRVRLAPGSIQVRLAAKHLTSPIKNENNFQEARLIDVICALDINDDAQQRLLGELSQTIALCRWNLDNLEHHKSPRRHLSFPELESAITEGHLYHPSFKTRTGFSLNDHRDFGPEAGRRFQFLWLAVKRPQLDSALPTNEEFFWQQELGEQAYKDLTTRLAQTSAGTWAEYALVPVHPWQFNAIADQGLAAAIAKAEIIELGAAGDEYQATQSLRTLINVSNPAKANIKIPLHVICTSSHRNLEQHFVCTAPTISSWLQDIVANDAYLQKDNKLLLLSEYAGLLYEPSDPALKEPMNGLVGCIFRESVLAKTAPEESAVPFTALMLVESDGFAFIADWLDQYGIEAWVDRLLEVMLMPIWHLFVHQGIAFEAHAQNLVLIHKNGWPEKIVLRDFHEDTEFVVDFLANPEHTPKLAEVDDYFADIPLDEGFSMESVDALRELFMDTIYVFNLADLAFLLERYQGYSEDKFWQQVRHQLKAYADSGVTDLERIRRVGADRPRIIVESLLTKKIKDGGTLDYYEHSVANTLSQE